MKTSWIIGIFMFYLILAALAVMIEQTTTMNSTVLGSIASLLRPTVTNVAGETIGFISFVTNIGSYIMAFIRALFLFFPSVWTGYLYWFWLFVCVPISVGMILSIVIILRGSSAN